MLVFVPDVTVLPRTGAVYKLMNFLMENIHPQQSHHHCCCMCYWVHALPFPHKTAVSKFGQRLVELTQLIMPSGKNLHGMKRERWNLQMICIYGYVHTKICSSSHDTFLHLWQAGWVRKQMILVVKTLLLNPTFQKFKSVICTNLKLMGLMFKGHAWSTNEGHVNQHFLKLQTAISQQCFMGEQSWFIWQPTQECKHTCSQRWGECHECYCWSLLER